MFSCEFCESFLQTTSRLLLLKLSSWKVFILLIFKNFLFFFSLVWILAKQALRRVPLDLCYKVYNNKVKSSYRRCPMKQAVLKNFAKFAAKYLCWILKISWQSRTPLPRKGKSLFQGVKLFCLWVNERTICSNSCVIAFEEWNQLILIVLWFDWNQSQIHGIKERYYNVATVSRCWTCL